MTLTEYPDLEQGSDAWLEARRGLVTASTVGSLITPSTVKPASNDKSRALVATLVAERLTGYSEPVYVSPDMERGNYEEPRARDHYSQHYAPVTEVGFMVRTLANGHKLGYSPDGMVSDDGLIEIKSPRAKSHLQTILADNVPPFYMAQLQAGLLVTGRQWIDFCSWHGGLPMFVKRVHPNQKWFDAITAAVDAFEDAATEMTLRYHTATAGLATTERAPDYNNVELKLA